MTNSKQNADSKVKREKNEPSRPASRAYGCRRLFALACIALGLICSVPVVLTSPELQWHIEHNIRRPPVITPAPASKTSEMIAFTCGKYHDVRRKSLYTVYSDGSHLRRVLQHPFRSHEDISWSPDGIWIAMIVENLDYNLWRSSKYEIYRVRFDGLDSLRLTYNDYRESYPVWSDDGGSISFISEQSIQQISANGHEISRSDNPHISEYVWSRPFDWSSDKQHYAFSEYHVLFYGRNPDGSDLQSERMKHGIAGLEWAPNGEEILYYHYNVHKLEIIDVKTKAVEFSLDVNRIWDARWSPDGNWIAIVGQMPDERSVTRLYVLDIQSGDIQTVTKNDMEIEGHGSSISWSPDSEWIAFSSYDYSFGDENTYIGRLFKIRRDGRDLQQLKQLDCRIGEISWSPK